MDFAPTAFDFAAAPVVDETPLADDRPLVTFADLKIRTKDKRLVTFQPNPVQVKYLEQLSASYPGFRWHPGDEPTYTLRGIREDVLKARQQGMSTLWLALYFIDTINTPLTQTIILAHDAESTEKLFKIIHRFWENLPPDKRRPKKYSSKREIEFSDIDSGIYVGTAGSSGIGRGGTINNAHLSERAFWKDGDEVETGLLEAIPADGNVTRETTANGMNDYYAERIRARNGESSFTPRFFGWFLHPEYETKAGAPIELTEDEQALAAAYGLTEAQILWRRGKARDLKEKFPQEYPATEDEAFLTSGNPYFDTAKLMELSRHLQESASETVEVPGQYSTLRRLSAGLKVWKPPIPGRSYLISADTAEGITDHGDHDYDSADVWDMEDWEQVAHLHGRWDTNEYGIALAQLGYWYNTALLAIERNNHGHAVINAALYQSEPGYPEAKHNESSGLYFHQEYDENKRPTARRPGYPTTPKTKYLALDQLATGIADDDLHFNCKETISELLTFVKLPGGKAGGDGASHDDRVSSAAIGAALLNAGLKPKKSRKLVTW